MAKVKCQIIITKDELLEKYLLEYGPVMSKEQQLAARHDYKLVIDGIYNTQMVLSSGEAIKVDFGYVGAKILKQKQVKADLDYLGLVDQGDEVVIEYFGVA
jgi:hypothetical protein